MATFIDLPNEIILDTLEVVLPEDLENFAQTSKRVFLLAKPFLKRHRELIRLHSTFSSDQNPVRRDVFWVGPITSLLEQMLSHPRIGRYIRRVELGSLVGTPSGVIRANKPDQERAWYKKQHDLINAVIAQTNVPNLQSFYDHNERLSLKSNKNHEGLLVALFLPLLPNLNKVSIQWNSTQTYFRDMIRQSTLGGNRWLANLTKVRVEGVPYVWRSEGDIEYGTLGLRDLSLFSSLPALKSLAASHVHGSVTTTDDFLPPPDLHTTELKLIRTIGATLPFCQYLESFRSLQTFTIFCAQDLTNGSTFLNKVTFDLPSIRAALLSHAKTTLRSLKIGGSPGLEKPIGSLQPFETLREIRAEWEYFFREKDCLETWPCRILPASLRILGLHDPSIRNYPCRTSTQYEALFRGLQDAKETTCLHLELVEISACWHASGVAGGLDELHRQCEGMGMGVCLTPQENERCANGHGLSIMSLTFPEKS